MRYEFEIGMARRTPLVRHSVDVLLEAAPICLTKHSSEPFIRALGMCVYLFSVECQQTLRVDIGCSRITIHSIQNITWMREAAFQSANGTQI